MMTKTLPIISFAAGMKNDGLSPAQAQLPRTEKLTLPDAGLTV